MTKNNYIHLSGSLSLSNGPYTSEDGDHLCICQDKPMLYTNAQRRYAVMITDKMVDDARDPEQVLKVIDKIQVVVGDYNGLELAMNLKVNLQDRVKTLEKERAYKAKVEQVDVRYPQVSQELKTKVKYFDRHYHYSDDNRVYNAGLRAEEALNKELALVNGAAEYAKAYFALTY